MKIRSPQAELQCSALVVVTLCKYAQQGYVFDRIGLCTYVYVYIFMYVRICIYIYIYIFFSFNQQNLLL